jgi:hypothetical protein
VVSCLTLQVTLPSSHEHAAAHRDVYKRLQCSAEPLQSTRARIANSTLRSCKPTTPLPRNLPCYRRLLAIASAPQNLFAWHSIPSMPTLGSHSDAFQTRSLSASCLFYVALTLSHVHRSSWGSHAFGPQFKF